MQGKVIAVTGAFGALGSAVVAKLAAKGALPVAIDASPQTGDLAASLVLPGNDIATPAGAQDVAARISAAFGRLDGLANIAGGFAWETIADGDPASWDHLYRVNVLTALNMSRAALPLLLQGGGAIVNIGAAAADRADAGMGPYTASKAAVAKLTEALAAEVKAQGVRVNAVLPSIIDTPANRAAMPDQDPGKWVSPAKLADVISFLLSEEASEITGASLPVSGRV